MGNATGRVLEDKKCTFCGACGVSDIDGYVYQIRGRGKHDGKWVCTGCLIRKIASLR